MDQIPTWALLVMGTATVTVLGFIMREVVSKLVDYIFSPVQKIQKLDDDVDDLKIRMKVCETHQHSYVEILASLKDDLSYIRTRLDNLFDAHLELPSNKEKRNG